MPNRMQAAGLHAVLFRAKGFCVKRIHRILCETDPQIECGFLVC